jgi:glycerol kinase
MLNIMNNKWLDLSTNLDKVVEMPNIITEMKVIGHTPGTSIPVFAAVGDQQASLLGAGLGPNIAIVNAGTGGQVAKLVSNIPQTQNKIRPYFEEQYIETITHIPAGRFIAKFLRRANDHYGTNFDWTWLWQDSDFQITEPPSPKLDWNYDSFFGRYINEQKSICEAKNTFLGELSKNFTGALSKLDLKETELIILAGGVAQKWKIMKREIQNEFGIPIEVSTSAETTLNGLAILDSRTAKVDRT